jgi:hypothetical protein
VELRTQRYFPTFSLLSNISNLFNRTKKLLNEVKPGLEFLMDSSLCEVMCQNSQLIRGKILISLLFFC